MYRKEIQNFFMHLFRGGKSFRDELGFVSSNINIIKKININVLKSSYNHIFMEVLLIELIDYSIIENITIKISSFNIFFYIYW